MEMGKAVQKMTKIVIPFSQKRRIKTEFSLNINELKGIRGVGIENAIN